VNQIKGTRHEKGQNETRGEKEHISDISVHGSLGMVITSPRDMFQSLQIASKYTSAGNGNAQVENETWSD
jgi:hypothetical protein